MIRDRDWTIEEARDVVRASDSPEFDDTGLHGITIPAERRIVLERGMGERRRLAILVHELLHAAGPRISEDTVTVAAQVIAMALWDEGWRRRR